MQFTVIVSTFIHWIYKSHLGKEISLVDIVRLHFRESPRWIHQFIWTSHTAFTNIWSAVGRTVLVFVGRCGDYADSRSRLKLFITCRKMAAAFVPLWWFPARHNSTIIQLRHRYTTDMNVVRAVRFSLVPFTAVATYTVKLVISRKLCKIEALLLETTSGKWRIESPPFPITLSNLQYLRPIASLLRRIFRTVTVRSSWEELSWHSASRGPSAISELLAQLLKARFGRRWISFFSWISSTRKRILRWFSAWTNPVI